MLVTLNQWLISLRWIRRVRTPTLLQMEGVECGPASLGIILRYYGCWIPLLELRHQIGVTRDGSNAANILKIARSYGLEGKGVFAPLQHLKNLSLPYIVFWKLNHFLVIEGIGKKYVYVNDPAIGRRKVSIEDFNRFYTGVVLTLKPGSQFKKVNGKKSIIPALVSRLSHSRNAIAMALVSGLGLTFVRLAVPAFSQIFIDEILIEGQQYWLRPLLLIMIMAAVLQGVIARLEFYALRQLMIKLLIVSKSQFFWKILRLPAFYYDQRFAGDLSSRLDLNDEMVRILSRLSKTGIDALMLVCYGVLMALYDRPLTLVMIGFAGLNLLSLQLLRKFRVESNLQLIQEKGRLSGATLASIQAIETIKASGLEAYAFSLFAGLYAQVLSLQQKLYLQSQILAVIPVLLKSLTTTFVLIYGGYRVLNGHLSIGMLVAYQMMVHSFLRPISNLVNFGSSLQKLEANLERLDDVLRSPDDPAMIIETAPFEDYQQVQWQGGVQLEQMTFGYSQSESPLIEDFNLHIEPGQRIALVGRTGSGKSTIAKLIAGMYPLWQGEIRFDQISRTKIDRSLISTFVATVSQDIFLFAGTIRENLTLWDSTVSDHHLVQACQDAEIHQLILSLPEGYDTQLSEGGRNLSGGERQRLEIARALVQTPKILILDEATSALDAELEWQINRNLRRRGCTCIIMAHRLSTIRDCDQILVIGNGHILEQGTHQSLWDLGRYYARLIADQNQALQTAQTILDKGIDTSALRKRNSHEIETPELSQILFETVQDSTLIAENATLVLDNPHDIWQIVSGSMDLYTTTVCNGIPQGKRQSLIRLTTSDIVWGGHLQQAENLAPSKCLMLMATESVKLQRFSHTIFCDCSSRMTRLNHVEVWFKRLSQWVATQSCAQVPASPQGMRLEQSGTWVFEENQHVQSFPDRLVWIRVQSGKIFWLDHAFMAIEPYCPLFPLAPDAWFRAGVRSEVEVIFSDQLEPNEFSLISSARFFQQLFFKFLDHQEHQQQQNQTVRTSALQQLNHQLVQTSLGDLAQILSPQHHQPRSSGDSLLAAAGAVGRSLNIEIRLPSHWESLPPAQQSIEAIARASKFSLRRVRLTGDWWKQEQGPLLAFFEAQKHPIALLTQGNHYVALDAKTGIEKTVNATVSSQLAMDSYQFYRPLPHITKTWEILRFSIFGLSKDLLTFLSIGIIGTVLGMVVPQATALLVDQIIPDSDRVYLAQMGGGMFIIALAIAALQLSRGIIALRVEQKMTSVLQTAVWDRLLQLPSRFFRQYTSGDLLIRILAIGQIRSLLSGATQRSLLGGFFALLNLGLMWVLSPQLSLIAILFVSLSSGLTIIWGAVLIRKEHQQEQLNGELYGLTVQLIQGVQKLRMAAAESRAFAMWTQKLARPIQLTADIQRLNDRVTIISEVLTLSSSILIYLTVASQLQGAAQGDLSVQPMSMGLFLAFNAAHGLFAGGITALSTTLTDILGIVPLWERAQPILQTEPETQAHQVCLGAIQGQVKLDQVSFRYREGPLTLDNVSLHANPGEYIAIVGASGSGKSTLFRLLLGLEVPLSGSVYYDGHSLADLDAQALRQQLGVVLQQDQVIRASIYDNITCGGKVSLSQAWTAAKMAAFDDDIAKMPMGMHTLISEGGRNLSGGQRQRLLIARALISTPKVILFDEATSALDNRSQRIISDALNQMQATRIVIAHRLSTVRHADRIYVMDTGQISQVGTFDALMEHPNLFSQLVSRQVL